MNDQQDLFEEQLTLALIEFEVEFRRMDDLMTRARELSREMATLIEKGGSGDTHASSV